MGNINLARIPDDWGQYKIFGDVKYDGDPQITHVDLNMLHNGHPSIRVDAHQEGIDPNHWREVNTELIPVKPGDHIVFKCWVKTGHSTLGQDGKVPSSVIILFDYYGASGRLREHSSDNPRNDIDPKWQTQYDDPQQYVPMNSDWTLRTLDTIVPAQVLDDRTGQLATEPITGIIACLVAGSYVVDNPAGGDKLQDEGPVWFADAELYINPTPTPSLSSLLVPAGILGFLGLLWAATRKKGRR
jgi:hypothetical protein